jgi:hypothetical protein
MVVASAVFVAIVVGSVALASGKDDAASGQRTACGTKVLYGKTLTLWVVGKPITCDEVARLVAGPCQEGKEWSCVSQWPPAPLQVWFKSAERFAKHSSTVIEARRYPCSQARVTAAMWHRKGSEEPEAPTYHQMLADDLVRCGQLKGKTYRQVTALLGRPVESSKQANGRYADWALGPERDSLFQVDSEYLTLRFDTAGRCRSARLTQG